jgi:hypothetical protein
MNLTTTYRNNKTQTKSFHLKHLKTKSNFINYSKYIDDITNPEKLAIDMIDSHKIFNVFEIR